MRTADVVRHLQIIRSEIIRYPVPVAVESLAIVESWVLEGSRLSDVVGVDPRVKAWIEAHPERPAEVAKVVTPTLEARPLKAVNRDGSMIHA